MTTTEGNPRVIIIGGGIAGLSAANSLLRSGIHDFLILEAKDKLGGRIHTETFDGDGKIELGAQWIHGEQNDFCRLVKSSGHLHPKTSWEGKGDFLLKNGEKVDNSMVQEVLEWIDNSIGYVEDTFSVKDLHENPPKFRKSCYSSMGAFLRDGFLKYLHDLGVSTDSREYELKIAIFQWGMSFQRIDNSCNQMTNLSLFRWPEFQVNPGELYNNFRVGAASFVDNILSSQLPSKSIRLNSPVANVAWNLQNFAKITLENGEAFSAECVLVTCSMGVLHNSSALFTPELPVNLAKAIKATGYGPIAKIFLKWNSPWWPRGSVEGFQFLWPREFINCCDAEEQNVEEDLSLRWPKSITGFDPVLDCPNSLLGWLGGPESKFVETLSNEEVGEKCAELLREFTGIFMPSPDFVAVSKWNNDEFFQGAYCYRSTETDEIYGDVASILSEPVVVLDSGVERPALLFAGEALSKTHYSTLHGAYESGESQAAKLIEYFRKQANKTGTNTQEPTPNKYTGQTFMGQTDTDTIFPFKDPLNLDEISQLVCQFTTVNIPS